jgi:hypothetical protein
MLIQSAHAGCTSSLRYIYRLFCGLGSEPADAIRSLIIEQAEMAFLRFGDMQQAQDLLQLDPEKYREAMELKRLNTIPGIDFLGTRSGIATSSMIPSSS